MEERTCKKCGGKKLIAQFARAGFVNGKEYKRHVCKACYHATKDKRRGRHMEWLRQLKESLGCSVCGIKDHRCLDFDHLEAEKKSFPLGDVQGLGRSKKRILEEVAKCQVLCANCHRIKTWNERHGDGSAGKAHALGA